MNSEFVGPLAIGVILGLMMGAFAGGVLSSGDMQKAAIKAGCAGYNQQTGAFEWRKQ